MILMLAGKSKKCQRRAAGAGRLIWRLPRMKEVPAEPPRGRDDQELRQRQRVKVCKVSASVREQT
jgi:hypothetical protein